MIYNIIILEFKKIFKLKSFIILSLVTSLLPFLYFYYRNLDKENQELNFFQFTMYSSDFVFDIFIIYLVLFLSSMLFSSEWDKKIEILLVKPVKERNIFFGKVFTINIAINLLILLVMLISLSLGLLTSPWKFTIDKYLIGNLEMLYRFFLAIFIIVLNLQLVTSFSILISIISKSASSCFMLYIAGFTSFRLLESIDWVAKVAPTATIRNWRGAPLVLDISWNIFNFNLLVNIIYITAFYTLAYFVFIKRLNNR